MAARPGPPTLSGVLTSDGFLRLVGAAAGGAIGYLTFRWIESEGYSAIAIVGICVALGGGLAARRRHFGWGLVVALLALVATALVQWRHSFHADASFWSFVGHVDSLDSKSKMSYLAVGLAGLWFGMGRNRRRQHLQPAG